jgi:choline dehydrogenase-like flavoprotein
MAAMQHNVAYIPEERPGYRPGQTTYNITSVASPQLKNRAFDVEVGCIVGGSSAVNGRVFQSGTAEEYNLWADLGGPGGTWGWESMFHYLKKV